MWSRASSTCLANSTAALSVSFEFLRQRVGDEPHALVVARDVDGVDGHDGSPFRGEKPAPGIGYGRDDEESAVAPVRQNATTIDETGDVIHRFNEDDLGRYRPGATCPRHSRHYTQPAHTADRIARRIGPTEWRAAQARSDEP